MFILDDGNGQSLGSSKQNSVDEIGDSSNQPQAQMDGQTEENSPPSNNKSEN